MKSESLHFAQEASFQCHKFFRDEIPLAVEAAIYVRIFINQSLLGPVKADINSLGTLHCLQRSPNEFINENEGFMDEYWEILSDWYLEHLLTYCMHIVIHK